MIYPLPKELHRWDGATLVLLGQVQVINEDNAFLPHGWAINTFSSAVKL